MAVLVAVSEAGETSAAVVELATVADKPVTSQGIVANSYHQLLLLLLPLLPLLFKR